MAQTFPLKILAGQALSNPLQIPATFTRVARLGLPDAWDPAACLTFQVSADNIEYADVFHVAATTEGKLTPYEMIVPTVPLGAILLLPPDFGLAVGWLKIRSGTRSQPVNQAGDRTFAVMVT